MTRIRLCCLVAALATFVAPPAHAQSAEEIVGTEVNRRLPEGGIAAGRFAQYVIFDSTYRRPRRIWIYTPPGYRARGTPNNLLVVFDGEDYFNSIPLPLILDTLLAAKKTPPFVAVFVDDSIGKARSDDLSNQPRFAAFIGRQLIPWVRRNFNVTRKADRTVIAGFSNGGLGASYIAFKRPDLFGIVYSQSGAFWRGNEGGQAPVEWLTSQYAAAEKRETRFVLDVGDQETMTNGSGSGTLVEVNRRMRDTLLKKGYSVSYTEIPGGRHDAVNWGSRFPAALVEITSDWNR